MSFEEIKNNLEFLDDWEDRYRYIIELGNELPPLSAEDQSDDNKVHGCVSQVWLATTVTPGAAQGKPVLTFVGMSDAHIVSGLVAVVLAIYSSKAADEILAIDARKILSDIGLDEHLTPQRSNGLQAMVERIQTDAQQALAQSPGPAP